MAIVFRRVQFLTRAAVASSRRLPVRLLAYLQLFHRKITTKIGTRKANQIRIRTAISDFVRRRMNLAPSGLLIFRRIFKAPLVRLYRLSISLRSSSFVLPSFCLEATEKLVVS
jgi:hypothetical protein